MLIWLVDHLLVDNRISHTRNLEPNFKESQPISGNPKPHSITREAVGTDFQTLEKTESSANTPIALKHNSTRPIPQVPNEHRSRDISSSTNPSGASPLQMHGFTITHTVPRGKSACMVKLKLPSQTVAQILSKPQKIKHCKDLQTEDQEANYEAKVYSENKSLTRNKMKTSYARKWSCFSAKEAWRRICQLYLFFIVGIQ